MKLTELNAAYQKIRQNLDNWYENEVEQQEEWGEDAYILMFYAGGWYAPVVRRKPEEWLKIGKWKYFQIIDPDGWDRTNFEESWNEEISAPEMNRRLNKSTIQIVKNNS